MDVAPIGLSLQLSTMHHKQPKQFDEAQTSDSQISDEQEQQLQGSHLEGGAQVTTASQAKAPDKAELENHIQTGDQYPFQSNFERLVALSTRDEDREFGDVENFRAKKPWSVDVNETVRTAIETSDHLLLCDDCIDAGDLGAISRLKSHAIAINYAILRRCREIFDTPGEWRICVEQEKRPNITCQDCGRRLNKYRHINVYILHKLHVASGDAKEQTFSAPRSSEFVPGYINDLNSNNEAISTTITTDTKDNATTVTTIIGAVTTVSNITTTATITTTTSLASYKCNNSTEQREEKGKGKHREYTHSPRFKSWVPKKRHFQEIKSGDELKDASNLNRKKR